MSGRKEGREAMNITREGPVKIGIKDIERAWRKRAKDARHIITDSERPGLALISNATSQTWSYSYKPRGLDPATGKRFNTKSVMLGSPATLSPTEARAEANRLKTPSQRAGSGGGPQGRDRRGSAPARLHCGARRSDYLALLPTKEKKGGGQDLTAVGRRAGIPSPPRRRRARNRV